jgi:Flp pilus assembly protein TadB
MTTNNEKTESDNERLVRIAQAVEAGKDAIFVALGNKVQSPDYFEVLAILVSIGTSGGGQLDEQVSIRNTQSFMRLLAEPFKPQPAQRLM